MPFDAKAFLNEPSEKVGGFDARAFLNEPSEKAGDIDARAFLDEHPENAGSFDARAFLNAPSEAVDPAKAFLNEPRKYGMAAPLKGFFNTLLNPIDAMKERSLPANIIKWMTSEPDTPDPLLVSVSTALSQLERNNMQDSVEYQELEQYYNGLSAVIGSEYTGFSFDALRQALSDDPGGLAAEFVNVLSADPYLMLTPLGYTRAAALAATRVGKIAAGLTGAATMGATIEAPLSTFRQLAESGEIDGERFATDLSVAALASATFAGTYIGVKSAAKAFPRNEKALLGPLDMETIGVGADVVRGVPLDPVDAPNVMVQAGEWTKSVGESSIDVTGGKSISRVNAVGKAAPSIEKMARRLEPPEEAPVHVAKGFPEARTHFERTSMATGMFMEQLDDALYPLLKRIKIPFRDQYSDTSEITKGLRGMGYNAQFKEPVEKLRKMLNDFRTYTKDAGMDVGYVHNFFPRVYSVKAIQEDGGQGLMRVMMDGDIDAMTANDMIARITKEDGYLDLTKQPVQRPHSGGVFGRRAKGRMNASLESGRALRDIPDEALAPYLENDLYSVLVKYIESGVQRAEWIRTFGQDGETLDTLVAKGIREAAESGFSREKTGLAVDRLYDLADAMQGQYRPIAKESMRIANKTMAAYQLIRTLPLATLSSLSEPFVVALRGGAAPFVVGAGKALHHATYEIFRLGNKKFPKSEYTRAIEEVGLGRDGALIERLTATFGGEVNKMTTLFFKLNGLHEFTRFVRVMANEAAKYMIRGHLKALAAGKKGATAKRYVRELKELGIDPDEGIAWIQRGASREEAFFENVKTAGIRFTNETVMNPRATVRPMWHSNPHYHLLAQLKGFQTTFGNTVVKRISKELARDPTTSAVTASRLAVAGGLMIGTALSTNTFREWLNYGPGGNPRYKDEDFSTTLFRAIERTGFTGAIQFALDALFAHRFGSAAVAPLLGPAASQIGDAIEAAGQTIDSDGRKLQSIENEIINAVPGVNSIKPLRDMAKDAIPLGEIEISELFEVADTGDTVRVMRNAQQIVSGLQQEIDAIRQAQQAMIS